MLVSLIIVFALSVLIKVKKTIINTLGKLLNPTLATSIENLGRTKESPNSKSTPCSTTYY